MSCTNCRSCSADNEILAVILDLDGTLLDTERTTKGVMKEFLGKYGKVVDWKKEDSRSGMSLKESSIGIVKDYDLPLTPLQFAEEIMPICRAKWTQAKALPGANRLIKHLHRHGVPFALGSNSLRKNIHTKISHHPGWNDYFSVILGSDQVKEGKPAPDLFLEAAKQMGVDPDSCLVIEDSLVGVEAAKAAKAKVVAIPSLQCGPNTYSMADSVLNSLLEFQPQIWGLPPFEDWVDRSLPIEPINISGIFSNGLLIEAEDDGLSTLPDQVTGVYFGWAKAVEHGIFKVLVGIRWDYSCHTANRKIKVVLIDGRNDRLHNQQLHLGLLGYIRSLSSEENTSIDAEMLEEDKSIANAALNLPNFVILMPVLSSPEADSVDTSGSN